MMVELPKLDTRHPTSLWDYLVDMPYMPSKRDRERIEKLASERQQPRRVRIWDYFFRPRPDDVGKSVRAELRELQTLAALRESEGKQLLQQSSASFANFEQGWRSEHAVVEARLEEIRTNTASRERQGAWKAIVTGIALAMGSVYIGILYNLEKSPSCPFFLLFLLAFPVFVVGLVVFFAGRRRLSPEHIGSLVTSRQKAIQDVWGPRNSALQEAMNAERQRITYATEMLNDLVPHIQKRIAELENSLRHLILQIPPPPHIDVVQEWMEEELKAISEDGEDRLGIEGDLAGLRSPDNPIQLTNPAEIQSTDLIPPSYVDSDRKKYLGARRFGTTSSDRAVRHFGVFYIEHLFVGNKLLARYSVFYDFIRGERIRESAPQQHYADVVTMEMRNEYRKVVVFDDHGNSREVELESEPSVILILKAGPPVTITLPSTEYYKEIGGGAVSNVDATKAAETVLRAITFRVKEAKKNLEVGQFRTHEPEV